MWQLVSIWLGIKPNQWNGISIKLATFLSKACGPLAFIQGKNSPTAYLEVLCAAQVNRLWELQVLLSHIWGKRSVWQWGLQFQAPPQPPSPPWGQGRPVPPLLSPHRGEQHAEKGSQPRVMLVKITVSTGGPDSGFSWACYGMAHSHPHLDSVLGRSLGARPWLWLLCSDLEPLELCVGSQIRPRVRAQL